MRLRDAAGEVLDIFVILSVQKEGWLIRITTLKDGKLMEFEFDERWPANTDIGLADLASAPALLIRRSELLQALMSASFLNRHRGGIQFAHVKRPHR
jgi:hypothetical protein